MAETLLPGLDGRRTRHAMKFTPKKATGTSSDNTPVFFFRDPLRFSDLNHAIKRDRAPDALGRQHGRRCTRSRSSCRPGIPKSFRHMHLSGSHTYAMINADNELVWVKFHFRTQQGIQNFTDAEAAAVIAQDRESNGRDPFREHRARRLPALDAVHPGDDRRTGKGVPLQSVRPDEGVAEGRLSADRGRGHGAQPLS